MVLAVLWEVQADLKIRLRTTSTGHVTTHLVVTTATARPTPKPLLQGCAWWLATRT